MYWNQFFSALVGGGFVIAGIVVEQIIVRIKEKNNKKRKLLAQFIGMKTSYIEILIAYNKVNTSISYDWLLYNYLIRVQSVKEKTKEKKGTENEPISYAFNETVNRAYENYSKNNSTRDVLTLEFIQEEKNLISCICELGYLFSIEIEDLVRKIVKIPELKKRDASELNGIEKTHEKYQVELNELYKGIGDYFDKDYEKEMYEYLNDVEESMNLRGIRNKRKAKRYNKIINFYIGCSNNK